MLLVVLARDVAGHRPIKCRIVCICRCSCIYCRCLPFGRVRPGDSPQTNGSNSRPSHDLLLVTGCMGTVGSTPKVNGPLEAYDLSVPVDGYVDHVQVGMSEQFEDLPS